LAGYQVIGILRTAGDDQTWALQKSGGDRGQLAADALPEILAGCQRVAVESNVPLSQSVFRTNETVWTWADPEDSKITYVVTVSHPWPCWHDTITDYVRQQWTADANTLDAPAEAVPGVPGIPVYTADFHNTQAESSFLAFCELDGYGDAYEAPLTWSDPAAFARRAADRLRDPIRPRLFRPHAIVVSARVVTIEAVPDRVRETTLRLLGEAAAAIHAQVEAGSLPLDAPDGS
jgi:hypothetical protein